ncbi:MAG: hypothetical protein NTV82_04855 [Candidatus Aminicenantes bacterium]|nr:hypothetical protein [Candidatus Aminicenantes bacterium]
MAKIKIKELSRELKVSQEELTRVRGGTSGQQAGNLIVTGQKGIVLENVFSRGSVFGGHGATYVPSALIIPLK